MEVGLQQPEPVLRGRAAALLGLSSVVLLWASVRWAHHWGPLTDGLVAAWSAATVGGLAVSIWSMRTSPAARRMGKLGLTLAAVSVVALAIAGLALAAGGDPAGACGGG